jgi:hypothetical protein
MSMKIHVKLMQFRVKQIENHSKGEACHKNEHGLRSDKILAFF